MTHTLDCNQGILFLRVFEQRSQLQVVPSIQACRNIHIVLEEFKEFLLEVVQLRSCEEHPDEGEALVVSVFVFYDLLGNYEGSKDNGSPVVLNQSRPSHRQEPLHINQCHNAAIGRELNKLHKDFEIVVDLLNTWKLILQHSDAIFPEKLPLFVLLNVAFFVE